MATASDDAAFEEQMRGNQLLSSAQKNKPDVLRRLISSGVDPSFANAVGQSALHIACLWGNVESCRVLLDAGANPNAKNSLTGATPLHMVVQSRRAETLQRLQVLQMMIQSGAQIDLKDDLGQLPLDKLENEGPHTEIFETLLQPRTPPLFEAIQALDANQVEQVITAGGYSPRVLSDTVFLGKPALLWTVTGLLQAVEEDLEDDAKTLFQILQTLLRRGADPNWTAPAPGAAAVAVSDDGDSNDPPLYQVCCALREAYTDGSSSWTVAILERAAVALIEQGNESVTNETAQLIHQCARRNQVSMLRFLLERVKVDVNTPGRQGMTALQFAARSGQMDSLNFLLQQASINVNAEDDRGKTALDAARVNDKEDAVRALEKYNEAHGEI